MYPLPTGYWQDDHNEIKNVPAVFEVVMSQCKELQHTLSGEDNNESHIQFEEEILLFSALVIRFHHHGHHIEANEYHDKDIKELLTDEVKHQALD